MAGRGAVCGLDVGYSPILADAEGMGILFWLLMLDEVDLADVGVVFSIGNGGTEPFPNGFVDVLFVLPLLVVLAFGGVA